MFEDIFNKQYIEVDYFDKFLNLSTEGEGRIYQLHRSLGVVYIDLLFNKGKDSYIHRINLIAPIHQSSRLKWDTKGFPYEVEIYTASKGEETEVKLYRDFKTNIQKKGMIKFLYDVALDCLSEIDKIDNCRIFGHTDFPTTIKNKIILIRSFLHCLSTTISKDLIDIDIQQSLTSTLGFDLWEMIEEENMTETILHTLAEDMLNNIKHSKEEYYKIKLVADKERREMFNNLEQKIVSSIKLEDYGFKKGFVVIKR